MGNLISHTRQPYVRPKASWKPARETHVRKLLEASPGLPVPNPTIPFWTVPPAPIATHLPLEYIPAYADIVIIGSGITAASFARTLFGENDSLHVVMLEARDACSGATGRNGGHINPPLYHDYTTLKGDYGEDTAKMIMRFRLSHLAEMKRAAAEEHLTEECQIREVETIDVFYDRTLFEEAKEKLNRYKTDMPVEASSYRSYEAAEGIQNFHLSPLSVGCISTVAGAVHPYRLVTGVLSRLLSEYPKEFQLYTQTPCTSITQPTPASPFYTVTTPRGSIKTPHIIHATNAYVSHLVTPLRRIIVPVCESMSAQRPGVTLTPSTLSGARSFVFYGQREGFDYLTQLPGGENELMFGAGLAGLVGLGNADDSMYSVYSATHISGALPVYFGERNWGAEGVAVEEGEEDGGEWHQGRVKALWSGILSNSADGLPWVGRLPDVVAIKRKEDIVMGSGRVGMTASPGEWISAGYSGEGMVHAWMSAKAVAHMVLGTEGDVDLGGWFPKVFTVTEKRWKSAQKRNAVRLVSK
ncbi:hypothetical protein SERLADRAFT_453397 [Serpula lacrymans var. lacrymans S7.9]|uniref:FAD dependent oxidoreductase domain-containing protein n=1 Tax=Serpula lacrymans var. lacrymans (strain S7.9) TaxID=578457 RepID=F8PAY4_SERL9|nr:uncharacterized protein SERLADRAFT_453397 [Serpula lacrymans var. lacrymans S7.9]EGO19425.1 hypothetical protein SERLADRAFT_453397 [Serpula lacrymans var. lacrymans S7.9]